MRRRGSTLVVAMLLLSVLFVAGLGFLSQRRAQYLEASAVGRATEALALAEAGVEDARAKMRFDVKFPPPAATDQEKVSYVEVMEDSSGVEVGSFEVTLDKSAWKEPYQVLVIRSTGRLGSRQAPTAQRTVEAEVDMDESRGTYFQVLRWRDLGGL